MISMADANRAHEKFLATHCAAVTDDLKAKRVAMAESPFAFLRATCFRFAARFAAWVPGAAAEFAVPAVGDAHLENFGTWRDAEGRLVWGVNDLDEAAMLPWPADLLRLAASALLAEGGAEPRPSQDALLEGYARGLASPAPFILDEAHADLRDIAAPSPGERKKFWEKIDRLTPARPPEAIRSALQAALPEGSLPPRFAPRRAGLGSLGRPRFVAIAEWRGGRVVREAKARLPSAWIEAGFPHAEGLDVAALAQNPLRAPDPWLALSDALVVRRLAPDSRKLDIAPGRAPAFLSLLADMGAELANIHASAGAAPRILDALKASPKHWLSRGAEQLAAGVTEDFSEWRRDQ